jgi:hypothetical protein
MTTLELLQNINPTMGIGWLLSVLLIPSLKEIWNIVKNWHNSRMRRHSLSSFDAVHKVYAILNTLAIECKAQRVSVLSAHNGGGQLHPLSPLKSTLLYEWVLKPEYSQRDKIQGRPLTPEEISLLIDVSKTKIKAFNEADIPEAVKDTVLSKGFSAIALAEINICDKYFVWVQVEAKHSLDEPKFRDLIRGAASTIRTYL